MKLYINDNTGRDLGVGCRTEREPTGPDSQPIMIKARHSRPQAEPKDPMRSSQLPSHNEPIGHTVSKQIQWTGPSSLVFMHVWQSKIHIVPLLCS